MSHLGANELDQLSHIADELRDVFAERGYHVDEALEVDPAFGGGWSRAALTRELAIEAVSKAASHLGVNFVYVNGSGRELITVTGITERRFRVRKAERSTDGSLLISASTESALAEIDDSLLFQEQWVFAYTVDSMSQIDEVVAAEVTGLAAGHPGRLVLRNETPLGSTHDPYRGGFLPSEEDVDWFGTSDASKHA